MSSLILPLLLAQTLCNGQTVPNVTQAHNTPTYCEQNTKQCFTHYTKQVTATTNPLFDRNMTKTLFPLVANQGDDNHTCGVGSKWLLMDSCTQLHQPYTPYHPIYGLNVSYVENQVSLKWKNVMDPNTNQKYDWFFDNNVAYFVDDLGPYYTYWDSLKSQGIDIDMIFLRWYTDFDTNNFHPYYSIITHNSNGDDTTLSTYELVSDVFTIDNNNDTDLFTNITFIDSESRAYFNEYTDYRALLLGCDMFPIGSKRSVTDLDANIEWYKLVFNSTIINDSQIIYGEGVDYRGDSVRYAHIKIELDYEPSATISFYERSEDSTYGNLTVKEWENAMLKSHNITMISPFCGIDRWFDNHYALELTNTDDLINALENIMLSGYKYTVYQGPVNTIYLYMPEPGGQSVQLLLQSVDLTFYDHLSFWNPEWCPMNCTNSMANYSYGERIFDENTKSKNNNNKDSNAWIIIVIVTVVCALILIIVVISIVRRRRRGKSQGGYQRGPTGVAMRPANERNAKPTTGLLSRQ